VACVIFTFFSPDDHVVVRTHWMGRERKI